MNRLIRTVKKLSTVERLRAGEKQITVFRHLVYDRSDKRKIKWIKDSWYDIFEGTFYNYQIPLFDGHEVHFVGHNYNKNEANNV